jgi:hypothetical protein
MPRKANKISTRWIRETREAFRDFLDETNFPDPERLGERGPKFKYPEWLIMFIAILSVKLKIKSYVQIHKMTVNYWDIIAQGMDLSPISEKQQGPVKKNPSFPWSASSVHFSTVS